MASMPIRSVCVITSIHPDYDQRIYKHCLSLLRLGFRVVLISPWPPRENDGIEYSSFPRSSGIAGRLHQMKEIWRRLRRVHADLYHFHDMDLVPLMTLWRLLAGKPVVYDVHENYPEEMLYRHWVPNVIRRPLAMAIRLMEAACGSILRNVVIVVDEQRATVGPPWLNTEIVRNYASLSLRHGLRCDHDVRRSFVLMNGSSHVAVGVLLFLDVAEQVLQRHPQATFALIDRFSRGDALRDEVIRRISEPPLRGHVELLPRVAPDQVMRYLNRATVGVSFDLRVPARIKALPTKLFEYMAAEVPIVATDLPYATEIIGRCKCGLLGRPEEPQTLVDAVCRLLDDPALARCLGRAGGEAFLQHYNWESHDRIFTRLYQKAVAGRQRGLPSSP